MIAIDKDNIEELRREISKIRARNPKDKIAVKSKGIEFNRLVLENKQVGFLIVSVQAPKIKKERLKQRDSGLNQVLCKIAKKNNIIFIIDFGEIQKLKETTNNKTLSIFIANIMQNIKLWKKSGNKVCIINKEGTRNTEIQFFLQSIGMSSDMAKKAAEFGLYNCN